MLNLLVGAETRLFQKVGFLGVSCRFSRMHKRFSQQKLIWLLGSPHADRESFDYSEEYDAQIA
jgi:hypothetical protein